MDIIVFSSVLASNSLTFGWFCLVMLHHTPDQASPAAAVRRPHRAGHGAPQHLPQHEQVLVLCSGDDDSHTLPGRSSLSRIILLHSNDSHHTPTGTSCAIMDCAVHAVQRGRGLDPVAPTNGPDTGDKATPASLPFNLVPPWTIISLSLWTGIIGS